VGGGNGVNLDPYKSAKTRPSRKVVGFAYMRGDHKDVEDFILGLMRPSRNPDGAKEPHPLRNWVRVVYGELPPELRKLAEEHGVRTVMNPPKDLIVIPDGMAGIMDALREAMRVAKGGESPRVDFSLLRPEGSPIKGSGGTSSGPVSFLVELFDNFLEWVNLGAENAGPVATLRYVYAPVLRSIRQGGVRRGAGMATLSVDHEDILDFITAKDLDRERSEGDISTFNISVLATEEFLRKVEHDELMEVPHPVEGKYMLEEIFTPYGGEWPEVSSLDPSLRSIPVFRDKDGKRGVPARWLFREIAWHAWATGEPGLIFIDRVNEMSALKGLGEAFMIKSTNPCFIGSTRIPTEFGLLPIEELAQKGSFYLVVDNRVPVGNRTEPFPPSQRGTTVHKAVKAFYTGEKNVIRIETREGLTLTLTPDHLLLTPEGYVEAGKLKPGDKLLVQSGEGLWSKEEALPAKALKVARERVQTAGNRFTQAGRRDVKEQYANIPTRWSEGLGLVLGWLVGDGHLREDAVGFYFGGDDFKGAQIIVDLLQDWFGPGSLQRTNFNTWHLKFKTIPAEFFAALGVKGAKAVEKRVPESIFTAPREAVRGFLRGLFSSDGTVERNDKKQSCSVRLVSSSLEFLRDVQLLLLNFGIFGRIHHRRKGGQKRLSDGRGGLKTYPVVDQYELIIGSESRDRFAQIIGFIQPEKQAKLEEFIQNRRRGTYTQRFETTVLKVEEAGRAPVYDLTEPATHSLIANGLVAHNCGEIPLTTGEPCDLGAFNLEAYVKDGAFDFETFKRDIPIATRFLDNVLTVNRFALKDNEEAAKKLRRLGLGVMGLADMLIRLGLPYGREEARSLVEKVMTTLREEATKASEDLAKERGPFPLYKGHEAYFRSLGIPPRRNVALLTVAPTGTTSMIMGVSSGIEPVFAPFVWRKIGGEYKPLIHPLFKELLSQYPPHPEYEKNGEWDWDKVVEKVQENHGSLQGLAFIPSEVQKVFQCAHDIHPLDHVRMQGTIQRAFDGGKLVGNSLSKTINLPHSATVEDVVAAYWEAYKTGCKGITVYRDGSREEQVLMVKKAAENTHGEDRGKKVESTSRSATAPYEGNAIGEHQTAPTGPVIEREGRLYGFTDMVKLFAQDGTKRSFLVTVNLKDGHPVEVILTSGKAGDEVNADSEALGRVVSIALQYGVPKEALIKTLRGINGGLYGTYHGRLVASKADLIAVALETAKGVSGPAATPIGEHPEREKENLGVSLPISGGAPRYSPVGTEHGGEPRVSLAGADICPVCGERTLVREEGCFVCKACGYSKCG
ncbi:MAG: LAGLIDADG family homing endonuclease, partial [Thermaceae bacterium]